MNSTSFRAVAVAVVAGAMSASSAFAGNLGFWYRVVLDAGGPTGKLYWISLPYVYTPQDVGSIGQLDAEDLVQDLQPLGLTSPCTGSNCAVAEVRAFDSTTGEYLTWTTGGAGTPFELEPGLGYAIVLRTVGAHTAHAVDVVGAHDPGLALSGCHDPGGVNLLWISLPPNLDIDVSDGIPGVLDAEDLGWAMGGPDHVFQLRRLNDATGLYEAWVVDSVYGAPFTVDLTRAVGVDLTCSDLGALCEECPWTWTPPTR